MTTPDPVIPMLGDPAEITTPGARQFWVKRNCASGGMAPKASYGAVRQGIVVWVVPTAPRNRIPRKGHKLFRLLPESASQTRRDCPGEVTVCTCQGEFIE